MKYLQVFFTEIFTKLIFLNRKCYFYISLFSGCQFYLFIVFFKMQIVDLISRNLIIFCCFFCKCQIFFGFFGIFLYHICHQFCTLWQFHIIRQFYCNRIFFLFCCIDSLFFCLDFCFRLRRLLRLFCRLFCWCLGRGFCRSLSRLLCWGFSWHFCRLFCRGFRWGLCWGFRWGLRRLFRRCLCWGFRWGLCWGFRWGLRRRFRRCLRWGFRWGLRRCFRRLFCWSLRLH